MTDEKSHPAAICFEKTVWDTLPGIQLPSTAPINIKSGDACIATTISKLIDRAPPGLNRIYLQSDACITFCKEICLQYNPVMIEQKNFYKTCITKQKNL